MPSPIVRQRLLGGAQFTFDANAAAFFTSAAITDPTQKTAVNNRVLAAKANGYWSALLAYYPFVGGAATPHSFNLVNPALYQITWSGTVTQDANGITGNGSTGYGDTGLAGNVLGDNSIAWGVYSRTAAAQTGNVLSSCPVSNLGAHDMFPRYSGAGVGYFDIGDIATSRLQVTVTDGSGLFTASRTASNACAGYRNGSSIVTGSSAPASSNATDTFKLLCLYSGTEHSSRNLASAFIGAGLSAAQVALFYTDEQAFQTALGRQV